MLSLYLHRMDHDLITLVTLHAGLHQPRITARHDARETNITEVLWREHAIQCRDVPGMDRQCRATTGREPARSHRC